ncbi:RES family NAD+ phosphorylase [Rhizobium leguminosarum]|uniref:RES family NAD+ phosphorylase n=1 Tax=Rhizobium leguminosarum TaxID=384 RepID=UPI001C946D30|nr:RES family NAD+ phosphorylase [Rhizobium leguminosarum]MBY5700409.1 RES family NAD+ phosphorylase [Rhizobium leguminosarum]
MSDRKLTNGNDDQTIFPDGADSSYLPVSAFDIDTFNDILADEIDSDFTSSICCCDECYEDFASRWPGVELHDVEFQTNSMSVDYCVEQSRLVQLYTAFELKTLKHFVVCPRCGTYVRNSLHIFEHPFDRVEGIEVSIEELASLGSTTPFLLLEHPFARSILDAVRDLSADTGPKSMPGTFFRARKSADIAKQGQSLSDVATFGPAPPGVIGEGRFNHAGAPMIYLATTLETAILEIGTLNELLCVAELALDREYKVLDLVELDDSSDSRVPILAMANSVLVAAPRIDRGWLRPEYVFSRFIADCAKSAGFDAIRYASTKYGGGYNYVILSPKPPLENYLRLIGIHER